MRTLFICVLLATLGCSRAEPESQALTRPRAAGRAQIPPRRVESIYDAEGQLRPSEESIDWLVLPMGLERTSMTHGRSYVYKTRVPPKALTAYFDHVVFTSQVELSGKGVAYRRAGPKSMKQHTRIFDISITPLLRSDEVAVRIDDLSTFGTQLTEEQARGVLAQELQRAE